MKIPKACIDLNRRFSALSTNQYLGKGSTRYSTILNVRVKYRFALLDTCWQVATVWRLSKHVLDLFGKCYNGVNVEIVAATSEITISVLSHTEETVEVKTLLCHRELVADDVDE